MAKARFSQHEVTRLIRGAQAAGIEPRVTFDTKTGILTLQKAGSDTPEHEAERLERLFDAMLGD